jgi:hypothetical protein
MFDVAITMARIICTRTDISLASSCDAATLHLLDLDRYTPQIATRTIASLVALQRQNGNVFLESLKPKGHVLAALKSMSPMAARFISCREVRRYKFQQHLHTKDTPFTQRCSFIQT